MGRKNTPSSSIVLTIIPEKNLCTGVVLTDVSIHNVPALAKSKVPHKYVERGLPVFSPLYLCARVFVGLQ